LFIIRFCFRTVPSSGYSIIEEYIRSSESPEKVRREFQVKSGVKVGPDRHTISNLVKKYRKAGSVLDDYYQSGRNQQQGLKPIFKKLFGGEHIEHIVI
jgi:hypothetical protein